MQRISVLFPTPLGCYDYLSDTEVCIGSFIVAPFGRKKLLGVVWDKEPDMTYPQEKMKKIENVLEIPPLTSKHIQFINWVAKYTLTPLGSVLKISQNHKNVTLLLINY